jgi:hypothetical protein
MALKGLRRRNGQIGCLRSLFLGRFRAPRIGTGGCLCKLSQGKKVAGAGEDLNAGFRGQKMALRMVNRMLCRHNLLML